MLARPNTFAVPSIRCPVHVLAAPCLDVKTTTIRPPPRTNLSTKTTTTAVDTFCTNDVTLRYDTIRFYLRTDLPPTSVCVTSRA